ncbi:MAG: TlpA family protein disulfide reductase [Saprospiraceae bacterium]|nr:MAG: thioredoxin [Bacteroidetes bacterium OLB9]MCO6462599.1 TlpA family protein disulfide reductase [Saprospiraceae bacterium]MCZ2337549.1 TlpA family protein disulfide reductase [Chitinophagales bacterium]
MKNLSIILLLMFGCFIKANTQSSTLKVGDLAPQMDVFDIQNQPFSLAQLKGKVVLIDFWASWCTACMKEQPLLKKLYHELDEEVRNGRFEIIGFSLDKKKENWQRAVDRLEIPWPQVSDLQFWKSPIAKAYGIQMLAFNVVIDENGKILGINQHGEDLEQLIKDHLN